MTTTFTDKLRDEIFEGQKRRHDFIVRKFKYCTSLLGLGSLKIQFNSGDNIIFTPLLFLVPLVAIAFDLYLISEDYGIKRTGEFLARQKEGISKSEKEWEGTFLKSHQNFFAPIAFFIITLIMLAGSSFQIYHFILNNTIFYIWLSSVIIIDLLLLIYSLSLRNRLKKQ